MLKNQDTKPTHKNTTLTKIILITSTGTPYRSFNGNQNFKFNFSYNKPQETNKKLIPFKPLEKINSRI